VSESTMNRKCYERLIEEDVKWLNEQPDSLESSHIECVLWDSINRIYGNPLHADLEKRYRRLLWESHAGYTHMPALYGDDGEMQCNHQLCGIDFKRQPLEQIEQHIFAVNLKRAALASKQ
jgi:hypothetical protein